MIYKQIQAIRKNLVNKQARGVFDQEKAVKRFGYAVESGAKNYCEENCDKLTKWFEMFPKDVREAVARELVEYFLTESELGNYDNYLCKKYQKKETK